MESNKDETTKRSNRALEFGVDEQQQQQQEEERKKQKGEAEGGEGLTKRRPLSAFSSSFLFLSLSLPLLQPIFIFPVDVSPPWLKYRDWHLALWRTFCHASVCLYS